MEKARGESRKTGNRGEDEVCRFLTDKGHVILERNWRAGHLEIDIISLASDGIHFVEVKSRKAPVMASPEESVGPVKQRRVAKAAQAYLRTKDRRLGDLEAWLDVAAVTFFDDRTEIEWFPDAYRPIFC